MGTLFVFSGGTACNAFAKELQSYHTDVVYCMPVSDNGGSTSEIMRVLGGPAIGDIRSRLLRLAPRDKKHKDAMYRLLSYRLVADEHEARIEWNSIVEGRHELWKGISLDYKQIIRSFMIHFHTAVLTAASEQPGPNGEVVKAFCFSRGSVGNFFFSGCRKFFNSLSAAITLWSSIADIPKDTAVLPIINSNHTVTIGAELTDGTKVFGQNQISHPGDVVDKEHQGRVPLPARVRRLFYLNDWRQEIEFHADPDVLSALSRSSMVVYSMGSLYTSICASLTTKGVGDHISSLQCPKVLILNGCLDRETHDMAADDFVWAIVHSCIGSSRRPSVSGRVDSSKAQRHGTGSTATSSADSSSGGKGDAPTSAGCTGSSGLVVQFVTHVVYLQTTGVPVNAARLHALGIKTIRLSKHAPGRPQRYDTHDLIQTILHLLRHEGQAAHAPASASSTLPAAEATSPTTAT